MKTPLIHLLGRKESTGPFIRLLPQMPKKVVSRLLMLELQQANVPAFAGQIPNRTTAIGNDICGLLVFESGQSSMLKRGDAFWALSIPDSASDAAKALGQKWLNTLKEDPDRASGAPSQPRWWYLARSFEEFNQLLQVLESTLGYNTLPFDGEDSCLDSSIERVQQEWRIDGCILQKAPRPRHVLRAIALTLKELSKWFTDENPCNGVSKRHAGSVIHAHRFDRREQVLRLAEVFLQSACNAEDKDLYRVHVLLLAHYDEHIRWANARFDEVKYHQGAWFHWGALLQLELLCIHRKRAAILEQLGRTKQAESAQRKLFTVLIPHMTEVVQATCDAIKKNYIMTKHPVEGVSLAFFLTMLGREFAKSDPRQYEIQHFVNLLRHAGHSPDALLSCWN